MAGRPTVQAVTAAGTGSVFGDPADSFGPMYRAIATDLDGTLLRSDLSVSDRTRRAFDDAEAAGLSIVLATGRPPRWIPPVIDEIGHRGLVVCANGASVYDAEQDRLIERTDIEPAVAAEMVTDLRASFPDAVFSVEQGMDFGIDRAIRDLRPEFARTLPEGSIGPIESFLDDPVTKLICRLPRSDDTELPDRVQAIVGERGLVTHSTQPWFLEISHPTVHKAVTVERLLVDRGIAGGEVLAFGDMPNDIELLRWAGLGVAMANASPAVRAIADEVTVSNDDDGVAAIVERELANRPVR